MTHGTNKPAPKLRKTPQPTLSHAGAVPDSDRAKRPPLSEPAATGQELTPGDRVEGLGNFGKPTGEFGTKRTRLSSGMTTVARDCTNRRSRRFRRLRSLSFTSVIVGRWRCEMSNSNLIRKHFSAHEHKDRKVTEDGVLHHRRKQDKRTRGPL